MHQIGKGRRYEVRQVIAHTVDGITRPQVTVLHSADTVDEANDIATSMHLRIDDTKSKVSRSTQALLDAVTVDVFDAGPAPRA